MKETLTWHTKSFKELTTEELYGILQLRSEVFVVEQDCVYQDVDNKDQKALHVFSLKNNDVVAYARIFKAGYYFKEASIGRVVVAESYRKYGLGHELLKQCLKAINKHYKTEEVKISAQTYLKNFYEQYNFKQVGKEYLEDGIPHITMLRKK
jgi:ElaA protein